MLTHETLQHVRSALDHGMRKVWEQLIAPTLSEGDRNRARVYFPIANDLNSFQSILGRALIKDLKSDHPAFYDFLIKNQPFSDKNNDWLSSLGEISAEEKHIRLVPQTRTEQHRIRVTKEGGGEVSWNPSGVTFGQGVRVFGAPVDPATQRIVPTPGVTERDEVWVAFILDGYGLNALTFCRVAVEKTKTLLDGMMSLI